jgi:hypothetical protein
MDHLKMGGFKCSLSVFQPESGLTLVPSVPDLEPTTFCGAVDILGIHQVSFVLCTFILKALFQLSICLSSPAISIVQVYPFCGMLFLKLAPNYRGIHHPRKWGADRSC